MPTPSQTPYLGLNLDGDESVNRNWALLDDRLYRLAVKVVDGLPAGGDLTGTYPDPTIADGAVQDANIESVDWSKITNVPAMGGPWIDDAGGNFVMLADFGRNLLLGTYTEIWFDGSGNQKIGFDGTGTFLVNGLPLGGGAPSGPAGGDLAGSYPNPTVGLLKIDDSKIAGVAWGKVTGAPSSFAPSGSASGDLGGTYPSPTVVKASGTFTLAADPTLALQAATKQYVDARALWQVSGSNLQPVTSRPVAIPGDSTNGLLIMGAATVKGRMTDFAGAGICLSTNRLIANGTRDDAAKPTWQLCLYSDSNDDLEVVRFNPANTPTTVFQVKGSDLKTYCTLADASVTNAMLASGSVGNAQLQTSAKSSFASGTVTANVTTTTTVTQFATITGTGLNGRLVMIFLNAMMGLTSTSGASNITIYVKRNAVAFANYNLYVSGGTFEVPVPLNLTVADSTAPSGSVVYTFEMQASVAGTNIHTAAANQGTLLLFSWPT